MQRYFVPEDNWKEDQVTIIGQDVHHIKRVMRMVEGDHLIVIHPEEKAYKARIESAGEEVVCNVTEQLTAESELPQHVTIVQALGKADKVEWVVQKATELGMDKLIPFQARHSVVKWEDKKQHKKLERMKKIAKEAAEQSERLKIPEISDVSSLEQVLKATENYDFRLFAYENDVRYGTNTSLSQYVKQISTGKSVCLVIGPEGGFSVEESEKLYQEGFQSVRLGRRILRMETAPLYFLSALSYEWEE
ncbi:16S rRNA (uracil(1498)-N(3))-methyltransferase [Salimicrobium flavidum]|uniref:Ribosomal RNA small subunit methyltransferase E n=1 Tax=Salimicrobium flavidum TaxID=570947 RepID=A0A1N7III4_9BACI|nr:16S rRNA (uracil(1498)-N(3))-methyltransferase [Salimicrobium flavidum]SIS36801.1 16S rRNA (uracil1498-N3)-methyltransferase [Salimicrobium flavidum]